MIDSKNVNAFYKVGVIMNKKIRKPINSKIKSLIFVEYFFEQNNRGKKHKAIDKNEDVCYHRDS